MSSNSNSKRNPPKESTRVEKSADSSSKVDSKNAKRRSPSVRRRSNQRFEKHRQVQGEKYQSQEKKIIFEQLLFGFREHAEMLKSLQLVAVPNSVAIPISTRAVGFMSQFLYCKFARLRVRLPQGYSVFQLFRITLLQIEIKVDFALREHCSRHIGGRHYQISEVSLEMVRTVSSLGANLAPMVNLINALGVCKGFGTVYLPRLAALEMHNNRRFPEPTTVTFSNLREVVVALADGNTPLEYRRYFYDHNAIPGCIWRGEQNEYRRVTVVRQDGQEREDLVQVPEHERFPILANPNIIIPDDYSMENLREDVNAVQDILETIGRKYPKYVHFGALDFKSGGNPSMLVSNDVETIRCRDLTPIDHGVDGQVEYIAQSPISGELSTFWAEHLSDPEFYMGVNHLFGKRPREDIRKDIHSIRSLYVSKMTADVDYLATLTNLIG